MPIQTVAEVVHERLLEATNTALNRFRSSVRQVYGATNQGRPEPLGSAILLKLREGPCVLTAAHNLDWNKHTSLYLGLDVTLRRRELDAAGARLAGETGLPYVKAETGDNVAGLYRQRLTLSFGCFAMIDNGLGFQLVPWSPTIEKHLGRHLSGIAKDGGGIEWSLGRKRGLGL